MRPRPRRNALIPRTLLLGAGLAALVAAAGAALLAGPAKAAEKAQFSSYIDDLPIMPGLAESDQGYAFDLFQGGRLAESRLSGKAEAAVVRGFYAATLNQLGWKPYPSDPYTYRRGGERLIFLVDAKKAGSKPVAGPPVLDVMFLVTPEPEGAAPLAQAQTQARAAPGPAKPASPAGQTPVSAQVPAAAPGAAAKPAPAAASGGAPAATMPPTYDPTLF